jgi:hypothetical protein
VIFRRLIAGVQTLAACRRGNRDRLSVDQVRVIS